MKDKIKYLTTFIICLYTLSPYLNNFFQNINTSLLTTILIIPLSMSGYIGINRKNKFFYTVFVIIVYIITIYAAYAQFGGLNKFVKILGIIFVPGLALYLYKKNIIDLFFKILRNCCVAAIVYAFIDYENLIRALITGSRSVYSINPLNIGNLASFILLITIYTRINGERKKKDAIFFGTGILGVIASGSKGPLIALIISAILILILNSQRLLTTKKVLIFILVSTILILGVFILKDEFQIISRLIDLKSGNNSSSVSIRQAMYSWVIGEISTKPLLIGHGIDVFSQNYFYGTYPHNIILELAYEVGLISAIVVFIPIIYCMLKLLILTKNKAAYFAIFLFIVSQFSHDVTFIRNILFMVMVSALGGERRNA